MSRRPTIPAPSSDKVKQLLREAGMQCDEKEVQEYKEMMEGELASYARVYDLPEPKLPIKYPRDLGSVYRPQPKDNVHNAWTHRMNLQGAENGKLAGKRVAIKDNIQIAGVPMTNGSEMLRGFVPSEDAVVVSRLLDAGARIIGTTNVEDMCVSGASFTGLNGRVLNPVDKSRSTGGSSSGSGVVVALSEVDMALGCDQGGSIRIPASWCGIVGLKPTFGLVSYTGIVPIETIIDHVGPMTRTVADCALMLEVLAGHDGGLDPRQHPGVTSQEYTKLMMKDLTGRKIAYVSEGFSTCTPEVQSVVMQSLRHFRDAGIVVDELSVPWHADAKTVWSPACFEGATQIMLNHHGVQYGMKGYRNTAMTEFIRDRMKGNMDYLSKPLKMVYLWGQYIKETCGVTYYAKSLNLERTVRQAYDDVLATYDVLLMPTLPYVAPKLPQTELGPKEACALAFGMIYNTAPFNLTGHPALSINAGYSTGADDGADAGLPVGLMIVGKHFDEATVLAYARTFEEQRDKSVQAK